MLVRDVISALETLAHPELAEDWDNCGLQVGDPASETSGCLLALDMTVETVAETRKNGFALLVVHHPALFRPLSRISPDVPCGQAIMAAIRVGVSVYAAHTSLDNAGDCGTPAALAAQLGLSPGPVLAPTAHPRSADSRLVMLTGEPGVVDALLAECGLSHIPSTAWRVIGQAEGIQRIRVELELPEAEFQGIAARAAKVGVRLTVLRPDEAGGPGGTGMLVRVPPMSLAALAEYVSRKMPAAPVRTAGRMEKTIETVALIPGSGGSLVELAAARADALITGECGYHDALRAEELGLGVVLAGHYDTERPVLNLLARRLQGQLGKDFAVGISQARTDPFRALQPDL